MTSTLRKLDTQHHSSLTEAARDAPNGGFKRLALPAVAAAVQTLARAKSGQQTYREWPEFLRRDAQAS